MNRLKSNELLIGSILLSLLVVGCCPFRASPSEVPVFVTSTPSFPPTSNLPSDLIVVTFTGKRCTVSGPSELPMGEHGFVLKDLTGYGADLYVKHLQDGKTFQDWFTLQREPGAFVPDQWWSQRAVKRETEWNEMIGGKFYIFLLEKDGEYTIQIDGYAPRSSWFCAPIWVRIAPPENGHYTQINSPLFKLK